MNPTKYRTLALLSLLLLVGLVAWSYLRWRGVKAELQRQESCQDV